MPEFPSHVEPVSLRELLTDAEWSGNGEARVRGCACDAHACRPGDVFVATSGANSDGHDLADEALRRGAVGIVAERPLPLVTDVPVCVVQDSREALGQICQALAGRPSRRLRVIGITGTSGKTTTAQLIASVLAEAGYRAGMLSTLGYSDGLETVAAESTTPPAPALAQWLRRIADAGCTHAVVELSSRALAERRAAGIELATACLLNLGSDHLDFHQTLANYHRAKSRIFELLAPGGVAVVNADDPRALEFAPLVPCGVLTVGMRKPADVAASVVERSKSEQTILLTAAETTACVRTAMIGERHVSNCLAAAAAGLAEGIDLVTIARGLENVRRVAGRLERIECGQPFGVYIDGARTPETLAAALDTLRQVAAGRVICVFGAEGNRAAKWRPLLGRAVDERADVAIVTTDNPRYEDPRSIAAEVISGFEHPERARYLPDRTEAIHYALALAGPDDCVLVAGRGAQRFQTLGGERHELDDRQIARRFLYNLEPASPVGALASVSNS
jgi:UDP-N-acetylmuramoyl-L-alanyl-D-glutamate--2,6-diaminopimelate ligase